PSISIPASVHTVGGANDTRVQNWTLSNGWTTATWIRVESGPAEPDLLSVATAPPAGAQSTLRGSESGPAEPDLLSVASDPPVGAESTFRGSESGPGGCIPHDVSRVLTPLGHDNAHHHHRPDPRRRGRRDPGRHTRRAATRPPEHRHTARHHRLVALVRGDRRSHACRCAHRRADAARPRRRRPA